MNACGNASTVSAAVAAAVAVSCNGKSRARQRWSYVVMVAIAVTFLSQSENGSEIEDMAPPQQQQLQQSRLRSRVGINSGVGLGLDGADLLGQMSVQSAASNLDPLVASESHHAQGYAVTSYDDDCCPGIVDPLTLFGTLAFIAGGSLLLRQIVVSTLGKRRKKRFAVLSEPERREALLDRITQIARSG